MHNRNKKSPVILNPLQFGFVIEHDSVVVIFTSKESKNFYNERNSPVYAVFLDNEKPNSIVFGKMSYNLWEIGINWKIWTII